MTTRTMGKLGKFEYSIERVQGRGYYVLWKNSPPTGSEFLDSFGEPVVVDEIGPGGMVVFTRKSDGFQGMAFPSDLRELPPAA